MNNIENWYSRVYGFEDCKLTSIGTSIYDRESKVMLPYTYYGNNFNVLLNKGLPFKFYKDSNGLCKFNPSINTGNKELLEKAKTVYVHPSCTLSRSMLTQKYKKCNNPWTADVVVIPKPSTNDVYTKHWSVFLNEKAHLIVKCENYRDSTKSKAESIPEGTRLGDMIYSYDEWNQSKINKDDVLDAQLIYVGDVLLLRSKDSSLYDILTQQIPSNKLVCEEDIQATLGNEDNKITFENLVSIREMLHSSDANTVSAAFKALSMMDWIHYPNSIRYILKGDIKSTRYNKATNSTSVKYMLNSLTKPLSAGRRHWPGDYDNDIYEQDFELFKKLVCYYYHIDDNVTLTKEIRYFSFMTISSEGLIVPNLKQE